MGLGAAFVLGILLAVLGVRLLRSGRARRLVGALTVLAACLLPVSVALAALPFTFTNGTVADANQVNANFQNLDGRVTSSISIVTTSNINLTDSASASWQLFANACINGLATQTFPNGLLPASCVLAANRKCSAADGLGFRFGIYVGEDPGNATKSILCLK
jgi:hypothetical protein